MKCCTVMSWILPPAEFEPWTLWFKIGSANHSATQTPSFWTFCVCNARHCTYLGLLFEHTMYALPDTVHIKNSFWNILCLQCQTLYVSRPPFWTYCVCNARHCTYRSLHFEHTVYALPDTVHIEASILNILCMHCQTLYILKPPFWT